MISQWMILYSIRKLETHSQAFQMSIFNARTLFQYNLTRQLYLKLFPPQFFKTFSILSLKDMFQYIQRGGDQLFALEMENSQFWWVSTALDSKKLQQNLKQI